MLLIFKIKYPYFHSSEPDKWEPEADYADPDAVVTHGSYEWLHSMGDIINSVISSGLRIEFLHEYPEISLKVFPFMEQGSDGLWRVKDEMIPMIFTLKAIKP